MHCVDLGESFPNSNEYLLAKIGVDTAENEPLEVWGENSIQYSLHSLEVFDLQWVAESVEAEDVCEKLRKAWTVVGYVLEQQERRQPNQANAPFDVFESAKISSGFENFSLTTLGRILDAKLEEIEKKQQKKAALEKKAAGRRAIKGLAVLGWLTLQPTTPESVALAQFPASLLGQEKVRLVVLVGALPELAGHAGVQARPGASAVLAALAAPAAAEDADAVAAPLLALPSGSPPRRRRRATFPPQPLTEFPTWEVVYGARGGPPEPGGDAAKRQLRWLVRGVLGEEIVEGSLRNAPVTSRGFADLRVQKGIDHAWTRIFGGLSVGAARIKNMDLAEVAEDMTAAEHSVRLLFSVFAAQGISVDLLRGRSAYGLLGADPLKNIDGFVEIVGAGTHAWELQICGGKVADRREKVEKRRQCSQRWNHFATLRGLPGDQSQVEMPPLLRDAGGVAGFLVTHVHDDGVILDVLTPAMMRELFAAS